LGTTLKDKLESELGVLAMQIEAAAKIMQQKYKIKLATLAERGADEKAIQEWLRSDAGRQEWDALKNEVKRKVGNTISRIADLGYFVGFANGR
jgi:anion-transporting  ArsA/GET3 family ATPase